ncbi:MAG: DUF2256 and DUF3253 domain-containing protein [Myxococcota bacterium]
MSAEEEKSCAVCGRRIEWRKKWATNWDQVRYCSYACRRNKNRGPQLELEAAILRLLGERKRGGSICPSEAARLVGTEASWRDLMEPARQAARRLVEQERVEITQKGKVVDPSTAKGPIRVRLRDG